ncbi:LamG-like jellyroll fold domain-containing protein [Streptomyces sp. NPDC005381]|uniref:LamG-like jellyroll fold domain-containing protein n=1 Tax=Streptomyces sp. NPDC005381 TaxID=3364714 RepID=UPI0036CF2366
MAGTEQAALAADRLGAGSGRSAPEQRWGSAAGRSHTTSAGSTDAAAKGGHDGPLAGRGELPAEAGTPITDLGATPKLPAPGPVHETTSPGASSGAAGFDSKRSKEIKGERKERERTFRNADGSYTTRFYTEPVNFLAKSGDWKAIDTTLVRREIAGERTMSVDDPGWEPESTESPVVFASSADADPLVRMEVGDGLSVGYGVDGASAVTGEVENSTVTYRGLRSGADLELVAGGSSVKETVVLNDKGAPAEWRFPMELEGLTAKEDGSGGIVFVQTDGTERAWMPPGWMQDSASADGTAEGAVSSGVTYTLVQENGRQVVVMKLDADWLSAPERVFPVRVDPSVKSFAATSGTYVESPYNQNFSTDTVLKVGTYDGGSHKAAAFLRFTGVESALKNAWVVNASLAMYNTFSQSCTARPVTVHPITSNWSESTTTKYPGPATGASLASKSFAHGWRPEGTETWSCGPAWEGIKLGTAGRKLVDDWTHGRKKNYGLAVKASTTDSKGWKQFGSDDYPNGKPSLDVTWTKYGATYKLGDFTAPVTATTQGVEKVTVTNRGQETWPKGGDYKLRYNLYDAKGKEITDADKIAYTEMPEAVSPGESVTVDAKVAPLTPGTYTVQWTMTDYGVSRFTTAGVPGPAVKISAVNLPPQLTAETPGSGVTMDSLTPTLWAKGEDADDYPKSTLEYTFEVCEVEGSNTRKNCKKGTRSPEQQWAVPAGWLSWGKAYAWYSYVYDGAATSLQPGAALFTTEVPQPIVTGRLGGGDGQSEIGARAGNYNTAATDAALATVGPELAVTRTYNSLDPRTKGAFGAGWSTRWDMQVRQDVTNNSVLVSMADGSQMRFGLNPDATYASPSGSALALVKQATGWKLRDSKGTTYLFLADGSLSRITDAAGRGQQLTRETDSGGTLKKVADLTSGRTLDFTWSGGHVQTVTTSAVGPQQPGLKWTYTYDGDRLKTVCPPSSATKCTKYDYEDGSVYRSSVLDAAPSSYWRLGDGEGATATSDAPSRTGLNDATYRDVQLGGAPAITGTSNSSVTFDGTDSVVDLPSDSFKATAFPSVELWFKTNTASGVLLGFQDSEIGEKADASWRPVLNIDATGKLRGEFRRVGTVGASGPITSPAPVTDNAWHHTVLTTTSTGQTLYLDGKKLGSISGSVSDQSRQYAYLGAGYASDSWMGVPNGEYRFKGQMDEVALYNHPLDAATVAEHYADRAAIGRITNVTLPSGRTHAVADYDRDSGRLTDHTDANGGTWKVSAPSYSSASAAYASTIQRSSPSGYWRLGEHSGAEALSAIEDGDEGSYRDGARPGGPGIFRDGDDTAAVFDGDGAVEVPAESLGTGTSMTVEMWFKTQSQGVLATMQNADLGDTPTGWRPMLLIDADGKLRGKFQPDADSLLSHSTVTDNDWHHAVLMGDLDSQALYLDGRIQDVGQGGVSTTRHPHVFIGGGYTSSGWDGQASAYRNFSGEIDEVAFYDRTLISNIITGWATGGAIPGHFQARKAQITGSGDQYKGVAVADAPSAYWRLGEEKGTKLASDVGGATKEATLQGGTSQLGSAGVFGTGGDSAVALSGSGSIAVPGNTLASATAASIELWFKTDAPKAVLVGLQDAPVGQTPAASWRPVLNIDAAGKLRGEFRQAGETGAQDPITTPSAVSDNAWHHAVLSGNASGQSLYLDGVKVGSLTGAIADQSRPYAFIGGGYASDSWMGVPSGTYYLEGSVDEAAMYRTALTADQVAAHYRAQAEAMDSGLVATVTVTDPKNNASSTSYDSLRSQRVLSRTDERGGITSYAYDTSGYLHTVTNPNEQTTVQGHDKHGNVVSTTTCRDANSCWTSFQSSYYNTADELDPRNNLPLSSSDARSTDAADTTYKTSYTYNDQGQILTVKRPDASTASTTYTAGTETAVGGGLTPPQLVATQKTPGGALTSYRYFSNGDVAEATTPSGLVTKYGYDGLGRKTSETQVSDTQPNGVSTTFGYDDASHITSVSGAGVKNEITGTIHTAKITRDYDDDGNLLAERTQDATGGDATRTTTNHYDAYGLNDSVTDAEQNTTTFDHDGLGHVTGMTDAAGSHYTYAYNETGQWTQTTLNGWTGDPSGTTRDLVIASNAYDPAGQLASSTDAMGDTTAYTYFDDGLPAATTGKQVTQADGSKHDIVLENNAYDSAGHLTRQVTGNGAKTTTYSLDELGRTKTSVLDPGGLNRTTSFTYDGDDRIKELTQSIGGSKKLTTSAEYDPAGNVTKQTVTDGTTVHITTATYDSRGLRLTQTTPRGNAQGADPSAFTTHYRHDALGRIVQETAPPVQIEANGGPADTSKPATTSGYNTFGEATETTDPRGNTTHTQTDRLGRTIAVTLPDYTPPGSSAAVSATIQTTYNTLGLPQTVTDPLGNVTRYGYNQFGQQTSKTDPAADAATVLLSKTDAHLLLGASTSLEGGGVTRTAWTPTGLQLAVTDPTGARIEATYDELGRQLTATTVERRPSLNNLTTRYAWDDANNQTASTTAGGITTTGTYNPAGEARTLTTPAGTTKLDYDGLGRQIESIDPTNRRSTASYDALDNITATSEFGTGTTVLRTASAEFDVDGNRIAVVSPQTKARTTFAYDARGNMTTEVEPVSGSESITTTFGYDPAGNRTRLTDGRGNKTIYTFNNWNLPESTIEPATLAHPDAADRTWTTAYDKAGQAVTEKVPGGVSRTRTYDALGRLTHETGSGAEEATTDRSLTYDLAGRLISAGTSDALTPNTYTYNDRGQLLTANGPGGTASYAYNADGNMTLRQTTAGATTYGYDNAGRIDWASDSITGNDVWYDFDAAGRPSLTQYVTRPAGTTPATVTAKRSYSYDELGHLKTDKVTAPNGSATTASITYGYDLDDNLTSKKTTGTTGAGDNTYSYDYADRLKSWTQGTNTTSYEWDAAGNRTKAGTTMATFDARNRQMADGTAQFAYSPRGTLISNDTDASRKTSFDAFDRKISDGSTIYAYDSLDRVQQRDGSTFTYDGGSNNLANDGTTKYNRAPDGSLLSSSTGADRQWALTDQHTDLVAGLTADGTQVSSSTSYTPFGVQAAVAGTTPALGYQSGYTDPTSGDINAAARWYQPGTGTFTGRDTWQLMPMPSAQANRYTYANGAPLNGTDQSGHTAHADAGGGYGSVGALGAGIGITVVIGGILQTIDQATRSTGGTTTGSYGSSYSFPNSYAGSASAINAQADNFGWQGDSALVDTGTGVHTCMYQCGRGLANAAPHVVTPPKPPIDQNPNNGKNPRPAPTRPSPRKDWDPKNGGWKPEDGVKLAVGIANMLNLIENRLFDPSQTETFETAASGDQGTGSRSRDGQDCRQNGQGWVNYGPPDTTHGGRSTVMESCLDANYLMTHEGSAADGDKATGYKWAKGKVNDWGYANDPYWVNACHLLSRELSGSGRDAANLSTCTRPANAMVRGVDRIDANFRYYEKAVKGAVRDGDVVRYSVEPNYMDSRVVASSWTFNATAWGADGKPRVLFRGGVVQNQLGGQNLGRQTDANGSPVPLAGTR